MDITCPQDSTPEQLAPWLAKLNQNPGACVVITIEHLPYQNYPPAGGLALPGGGGCAGTTGYYSAALERQLELTEIPADPSRHQTV
jgi:hypothetical protein